MYSAIWLLELRFCGQVRPRGSFIDFSIIEASIRFVEASSAVAVGNQGS